MTLRHGHDRETGRHRCARQHHAGRAADRGGPGAGITPATNGLCRRRWAMPSWCWRRRRAGCHLFLDATLPAGWPGQRSRFPAAQGQARQSLQCVVGGGVQRRLRAGVGDEGRGVRTIIDMVQLTRLDCADLVGRADACGAVARHAPCALPHRVSEEAHRPADDARVLADSRLIPKPRSLWRCGCAGPSIVLRAIRLKPRCARIMTPVDQILDLQDRARLRSMRRWNASAATVMSRKRWRDFIAKRRSTRSGRAPATSWPRCGPRAAREPEALARLIAGMAERGRRRGAAESGGRGPEARPA